MSAKKQENPLLNILINVIIPVLALSYLSKDPELQQKLGETVRPWHIGPIWSMALAVCLPLGYGIYDGIQRKKVNFFSVLGVIGVGLTGGLTLMVVGADGTIHKSTPEYFGLKEAAIPLIFAAAFIGSHFTKAPLIRTFLYTPELFDVKKIERHIDENNNRAGYNKLIWHATLMMAASFLLSCGANFLLAKYFLDPVIALPASEQLVAYNEAVGRILGWGFAVIGLPMMIVLIIAFMHLATGLKKLTGIEEVEKLMMPR